MAKTPAWTRKEGKSPSGGLNAKGRASLKDAKKAEKSRIGMGNKVKKV